ncbi:MAG: hypothetical protein Kow0010_10590 [Dehalococcoidia bacterium]
MDGVLLAGRILFAALFVMSAFGHFARLRTMAEYTAQMGVPFPEVAVLGTGVLIGVGGVLFVLGAWADLAALLLVGFLVPTAFIMHRFWGLDDPQMAQNQQVHFMKNIALAGAALIAFAFFQQFGADVGLTLTDPLFD